MIKHLGIKNFSDLKYQKEVLSEFISSREEKAKTFLEKALQVAEKGHEGQFRDEGEGYIIHPIRAANSIIYELKIDDIDLVAAALLHDVVEDSDTSIEEIKHDFGDRITQLVDRLTRRRPPHESEEEKRENKRKKFVELMDAKRDVRLVKCADLLDNVRCWSLHSAESPARKKFPRWFDEAEHYYLPMAEKTDKRLVKLMREALALARES